MIQINARGPDSRRLVALVALAFGLATCLAAPVALGHGPPTAPAISDSAGGEWTLTTHDGHTLDAAAIADRPLVLYFGYTQCPDVCPIGLRTISLALARLGADADRLRVLFVTVDPAHDTPAVLRDYLAAHDRRIIGLTGSPTDVFRIARAFGTRYYSARVDGARTVSHLDQAYLRARPGGSLLVVEPVDDPARLAAAMRTLLGDS